MEAGAELENLIYYLKKIHSGPFRSNSIQVHNIEGIFKFFHGKFFAAENNLKF